MTIRECLPRLTAIGISYSDACELRRIAMTLHRWHEMECGGSNNYASWSIVRGHKANGEFVYDDNGAPWIERHWHDQPKARYEAIADRERGAQKRLGKIMARYPDLWAYVQTDPRGAALYIGQVDRLPVDAVGPADSIGRPLDLSSNYTRGVAVYR